MNVNAGSIQVYAGTTIPRYQKGVRDFSQSFGGPPFVLVPKVALSFRALSVDYDIKIYVRVSDSTSTTTLFYQVSTVSVNVNSYLTIMYMASDHSTLGIFIPGSICKICI